MEKKVESPTSQAAAGVSKESCESAPSSCSPKSEGLELARMFQQLSVTRPHGKWRERSHCADKQPLKRLKKYDKFKPEKKLPFRKSSQKIKLKPSRLCCLNVTDSDRSSSPPPSSSSLSNPSEQADNFSEFLSACSREIATIEESEQQKQRKSSTCAQQAREEHDHSAVNFSIDVLTDYLEETVLLPKKMSYMAELMYT